MTRTWTTVADGKIDRATVSASIEGLQWTDAFNRMSFSAGYAIKAAIQECRIPKPLRLAEGSIGPIGLYGIEARYSNGLARVYVLDFGTYAAPVASDFAADEEARNAA